MGWGLYDAVVGAMGGSMTFHRFGSFVPIVHRIGFRPDCGLDLALD